VADEVTRPSNGFLLQIARVLLTLPATYASTAMAASHLIFLGTYTRNSESRGIYATRLDGETGALSTPKLAAEAIDPAWLTLSPDRKRLYAIHGSAAQAVAFNIDVANAKLSPLTSTGSPAGAPTVNAPSHLAVDATGRVLLAANYRDGFVAAIPISADGSLGTATKIMHEGRGTHPTRQEKPHVHSVTLSPDNRFVIVADLGLDRLYTYALDAAAAKLTAANPAFVASPAGSGPRHFKFSVDGRHGYVINELDNTIGVFNYEPRSGALTPLQTISTLPAGFTGQNITAEVRVHPNGRFLYGSNRGDDSIAVYSISGGTGQLSLVEIVKTGGRTPRNFSLSADGRWLVCGHQDTALVTVFRIDASSGRLTRTTHTAQVPSCVCVQFVD
jgi:6-phosphogluconolactonase